MAWTRKLGWSWQGFETWSEVKTCRRGLELSQCRWDLEGALIQGQGSSVDLVLALSSFSDSRRNNPAHRHGQKTTPCSDLSRPLVGAHSGSFDCKRNSPRELLWPIRRSNCLVFCAQSRMQEWTTSCFDPKNRSPILLVAISSKISLLQSAMSLELLVTVDLLQETLALRVSFPWPLPPWHLLPWVF